MLRPYTGCTLWGNLKPYRVMTSMHPKHLQTSAAVLLKPCTHGYHEPMKMQEMTDLPQHHLWAPSLQHPLQILNSLMTSSPLLAHSPHFRKLLIISQLIFKGHSPDCRKMSSTSKAFPCPCSFVHQYGKY
jgi:hypothetical protein